MSSRSNSRKADSKGERVQKVLANAGLASRREIDRLIQAGRVVIDGRPAIPGDRLLGGEKVFVDGRQIRLRDSFAAQSGAVLAYHKPVGEISARRDPDGRKTVFEVLPRSRGGRWIVIGRLDLNTSGLLLFTTDGELAHRLMHPSFEIEREYAVRIRGELSREQLDALVRGVKLDDGLARFDHIAALGASSANSWYQVCLHEGRNREVRRMFDAIGVTVSRLIRTRFGPVDLDRMPRGRHRLLEDGERDALYAAVGMQPAALRQGAGKR